PTRSRPAALNLGALPEASARCSSTDRFIGETHAVAPGIAPGIAPGTDGLPPAAESTGGVAPRCVFWATPRGAASQHIIVIERSRHALPPSSLRPHRPVRLRSEHLCRPGLFARAAGRS